jgi:hypothetical protein
MREHLFAMLILASWAQVKGDERAVRQPPARGAVVNVMVGGDNQRLQQITVSMPAPPAPASEDDDEPPAPPIRRININAAVVDRENFDRWLFADERTQKERWRHLEEILDAKILLADLEPKLTLTVEQRAKLRVAGRGDIKRFFDQVEDRRREFEMDRQNFKNGLAALRRLDSLSRVYQAGPFGDGSLFAKTLHRISDDQKAGR